MTRNLSPASGASTLLMLFGKESENWREIWLQQMLACCLSKSSGIMWDPILIHKAAESGSKWPKMRYSEVWSDIEVMENRETMV